MIEILLTHDEETQCEKWGIAINDHKEAIGKSRAGSKRYEGLDPDLARVSAIRSELAVAKILGLPYDVKIFDGGDGGVDLWLDAPIELGRSIQVKWRSEAERDIATDGLNFHHDLKSDIYVLTWPGKGRRICIVGYCTKADYIKRILEKAPDRLRGLKYAIKWQDLRPIEELVQKVHYAADAAAKHQAA